MVKIKVSGLVNDSIVDGPGLRLAIFTQGCTHNCLGCHNPQTHDIHGGEEKELTEIVNMIKENTILDGITLSGGEPFLQARELNLLLDEIPDMHIVAYTGYTYKELLRINDADQIKLLNRIDVLIDGRFILDQRSLLLPYRGSKNQRIINVKASSADYVVEYEVNDNGDLY